MLQHIALNTLPRKWEKFLPLFTIFFFTFLVASASINTTSVLQNAHIAYAKVDTGGGTLPLHNFSLTVTLKENIVSIKWLAENEMNTEKFYVQRSFDGEHYTDIASQEPVGPINILTSYSDKDDVSVFSSATVLYYRIRANDQDGKFAYSNVAPVRLNSNTSIQVWPNPFVNEIRISYAASANTTMKVVVMDMSGKICASNLFEVDRGTNQLSLDGLSSLHAGIYYIQLIEKGSQNRYVYKMTK